MQALHLHSSKQHSLLYHNPNHVFPHLHLYLLFPTLRAKQELRNVLLRRNTGQQPPQRVADGVRQLQQAPAVEGVPEGHQGRLLQLPPPPVLERWLSAGGAQLPELR